MTPKLLNHVAFYVKLITQSWAV